VPVRAVRDETHDTKVLEFALPAGASLGLPVSSALLMRAPGAKDGKDAIKPYNPISPNRALGSFELLVKAYPGGGASAWACALRPGDMVGFKQVKPNIKPFQYPFAGMQRLTMIAGGTGIAPMIQALYPLLETPGEVRQVRVLYGNKTPDDILLKERLDALQAAHPDRLSITYVVGEEEDDDRAVGNYGWEGETGWVDEERVRRLAFPPAEGTVVWVCGVDGLYESMAGSRLKPLTADSILGKLGYTEAMVWRS
jgi:cytochrome-b5 reductase